MRRSAAVMATLALTLAGPAIAEDQPLSSEAAFYVQEHVKGGCEGRGGHFDTGVWEQDLTGDGLADLIVDHGGVVCDGASESAFCNTRGCALFFYVNGEDGLDETLRGFGSVTSVEEGTVPLIGLVTAAGPVISLQWDGASFTPATP